jgi:hypothetical protein
MLVAAAVLGSWAKVATVLEAAQPSLQPAAAAQVAIVAQAEPVIRLVVHMVVVVAEEMEQTLPVHLVQFV